MQSTPNQGNASEQSSELLTLAQAAARIPTSNGKRVATATVFRWCRDGVRGVKLAHLRFGRRIAVTPAALEEFARAVAAAHAAPTAPTPTKPAPAKARTAAKRERDHAAAEARLRAAGVKV